MRIAVILNGISLERQYFYRKVAPMLRLVYETEVFETLSRNDAFSLASKAVDSHYDIIIAAGGDGTLHQVVNGILKGREGYKNLPALVVFPVGTGNDFARTLNIPSDPVKLVQLLQKFEPQWQQPVPSRSRRPERKPKQIRTRRRVCSRQRCRTKYPQ